MRSDDSVIEIWWRLLERVHAGTPRAQLRLHPLRDRRIVRRSVRERLQGDDAGVAAAVVVTVMVVEAVAAFSAKVARIFSSGPSGMLAMIAG